MSSRSIWLTWKPYAALAIALAIGVWWYQTHSPWVGLKTGTYDCLAVFADENGKYELLVDEQGAEMRATATVKENELASLTAETPMAADDLKRLIITRSGNSTFEAKDEAVPMMYYAFSCKFRQ